LVPGKPSLRLMPDAGWTFSTWLKIDEAQSDAYVLHSEDGANSLMLGIDGTGVYGQMTAGGASVETAKTTLTTGDWHHVALVAGNGQLTVYLDGKQSASVAATLVEMGGQLALGAALSGSNGLVGELDEVRVSNIARGPAWIQAAAQTQGPDAALLRYGEDEQAQGSGGDSYFSVILQNVTLDGWVVIVLLVIMAVISWVVMLGKGMVIGRIRKDNRAFIEAFHELGAGNPVQLDQEDDEESKELSDSPLTQALFGKHDHFQSSSIYRVYHAGVQDLRSRFSHTVGAQEVRTLSPQAINTLRASLDAAQVRETQRLNSQMVLLTIAISGGPFLGLLGTVVGVMITFAAIAASGDVNINAIAPGIAAALVATVAGLAVAIPALFGYNYLSSRVKEITADMQVFVDEFITRIAEHYAE
jgi:biopolymer transport protein ExbB